MKRLTRSFLVVVAAAMTVAIGNAAQSRGSAAAPTANVAWGLMTAAMVIAVVVPGPLALTVMRVLVPAAVPAAVAAWALGSGSLWGVIALVAAVLSSVVALSAEAAANLHYRRYTQKT